MSREVLHLVGLDPARLPGLLPDVDEWIDDNRSMLDRYAVDVSDQTDEHIVGAQRDWRWGWSDELAANVTNPELAAHARAAGRQGATLVLYRLSNVRRRCRDGAEMPAWPSNLRPWVWPARMAPFTA